MSCRRGLAARLMDVASYDEAVLKDIGPTGADSRPVSSVIRTINE